MREINFPYVEASWAAVLLLPIYFIRVNRWLNPFIIYSYLSIIYFTQNPFHRMDYPVNVLVSAESQTYNFGLMLVLFILFMKSKISTKSLELFLAAFGILSVFASLLVIPLNHPFISGFVPNKSMNAILNVSLLPFLKHPAMVFFSLVTIAYSKATSAWLALSAVIIFYFRRNVKLMVVIGGACLVTSLVIDKPFDSMRWSGYQFFLSKLSLKEWLIGRGPGSFMPYSVFEQVREQFQISKDLQFGNGLYLWMHSDPLQLLYEFGVLGVLAFLPIPIYLVKYLKGTAGYSMLALVVGSFFYYNFHWSIHLVVVFSLLKIAANNYSLNTCQKSGHG